MSNNNTFYSRRLFLTRGVQLLSVAGTVPLFLDRSGRAMAAEFAVNPPAEPENVGHSGWLGRYFDNCCSGADPGPAAKDKAAKDKKDKAAEPDSAVALTNAPPTALSGEKFLPIAFRNLDGLAYRDAAKNAA